MGTWGAGIFDNDLSGDVKTAYLDLLREGYTTEQATRRLLADYADLLAADSQDDAEDFWLGLAAIQWTYGRLVESVKEKACRILTAPSAYFEDPAEAKKRKQIERDWLQRLQGDMPPPKKIKVRKPFACPWSIGDIFALPVSAEKCRELGLPGTYMAFQKVGTEEAYPKLTVPVLHVSKRLFETCPTVEEYMHTPLLPQFFGPESVGKWWNGGLIHLDEPRYELSVRVSSLRSYPKELIHIGHSSIKEISGAAHQIEWKDFEYVFFMMYTAWKDIDAENL